MATFVVAEDEFWQPGLDFAAAMRHRGHRVVRLVAQSQAQVETVRGLRRWARMADRTVAHGVTDAGVPSQKGLQALDAERPVDWQATESVLNWLSVNGYEQRLSFQRSAPLPPHEVQDKRALTAYLESVGFDVPQTWNRIEEVPVDEPGPFMFKLPDSGGGVGIHRCESLAELQQRVVQYAPMPYIVQRFYDGQPTVAAGVARGGRIVSIMTYTSTLNPKKPFMMAYGLTVTDDSRVDEYAREVVAALQITGPFALDTSRDASGRILALDLNLRIWGSWTACQAAGLDVIGSYEHAMGLGPAPQDFVARVGLRTAILRRPPLHVDSSAQRVSWLSSEAAEIRRRADWLGWPWARASLWDSAAWAAKGSSLGDYAE